MSKKNKNEVDQANKIEPNDQPISDQNTVEESQPVENENAVAQKLQEEFDSVTKELEELKDRHMRMAAEYDNFRKRSAKEKEGMYLNATINTVAAMLPVYDNLERALATPTEDAAFFKGVEMIYAQFKEVFSKLGVAEMGAQGEAFNPDLHNAVMHVEDESLGENVIAEVFQKGFVIGERVVRHAMVKVAN